MTRRWTALAAAWLLCHAALAAGHFSFALVGDTPYTSSERELMPRMLAEIAKGSPAFVVHVGDFKSGTSICDDAVFLDRLRLFDASPAPLIYTPGDNEWTDCDRAIAGGYDPQERLARLRELFFADDASLGHRRIVLERQSRDPAFAAYRENARWRLGSVLFVTLNVPGSNNNMGRPAPPNPEFLARGRANRAWLDSSFGLARRDRLAGIVIMMQADPNFEAAADGRPKPAYRALLQQLSELVEAFPGQVVLVHGDSHVMQIDRPLHRRFGGAPLKNFTRVQTYGSPFMGWVEVTVDEAVPGLFRFESRSYPGEHGRQP
jgi:hypothetical protein